MKYHCLLKIIEGKDLPLHEDARYPYLTFLFESTQDSYKTKTIKKSENPVWNKQHDFVIFDRNDTLIMTLSQRAEDEDIVIEVVPISLELMVIENDINHVNIDLEAGGSIYLKILILDPEMAKELTDVKNSLFFKNLSSIHDTEVDDEVNTVERNYIIIVDKGAMGKERWKEAKEALFHIAPFVCKADPDGITLYFFSNNYEKYRNITNAKKVEKICKREGPGGASLMAKPLKAAFDEHFSKPGKQTTILVITDGKPNDKEDVEKEIKKAAGMVQSEEELSLTFIQIGDDEEATEYLQYLDDDIACATDIVDTISCAKMKETGFAKLIYLSLYN